MLANGVVAAFWVLYASDGSVFQNYRCLPRAVTLLPAAFSRSPSWYACVLLLCATSVSARAQDVRQAPDSLLRVCSGGDVTLGTNLDSAWVGRAAPRFGPNAKILLSADTLLAPLRPLVSGADVVLLNIEGAIGEGPAPRKCRPGSTVCYAMRSPIDAADAIRRLAGDGEAVGNLANNHARDAGTAGLGVTRDHLTAASVHVTGADTLATVVTTTRGDTVAVLGFSAHAGPDMRDLDGVRRHVARAAAQYARVVVTAHVGAEGRDAMRTRDTVERFVGEVRGNSVAFARTAVDAGADLIVGHGPHVLRALEWRGDALVAYSLGNLVTYGPFSVAEPANRGAMLCVALGADGTVREARFLPTRQRAAGFVAFDASMRGAAIADSLGRLDFPATRAVVDRDGWVTRVASTPDSSLGPKSGAVNEVPGP